jgi:UDPglucose 6-dehydrogenase
MGEAQRVIKEPINYAHSPMEAIAGADALVILTEWKEFRSPDFEEIAKQLKTKRIFDGRNLYEPSVPRRAGIAYEGIGRRA